MARQLVADKKEKSLGEIVIIVIMLSVLMASFIYYFFKQEQVMTGAGFSAIASTFSSRVNAIHGQWFMDKQPAFVDISSGSGEDEKVFVNRLGWVDSQGEGNNCLTIWRQVMNAPMMFMKSPIAAVEIRVIHQQGRVCQYALASTQFFEYDSSNGKVSKVRLR